LEKETRDPDSIDTLFVEKSDEDNKMASGFVRSDRNMQLRKRD